MVASSHSTFFAHPHMQFMVLVTFVRLKEAPSKKNQPPSVDTMKTDKSSHKQNKASWS